MIKALPTFISLMLIACATASIAQGQQQLAQPSATPPSGEAEGTLARDSRAAIIAAGISERYFDAHFTRYKVFSAPGDRRVIWRFSVNGHEALVGDTVGFYTDAGGRRIDTHSIASALPSAHDITRTVTRRRERGGD